MTQSTEPVPRTAEFLHLMARLKKDAAFLALYGSMVNLAHHLSAHPPSQDREPEEYKYWSFFMQTSSMFLDTVDPAAFQQLNSEVWVTRSVDAFLQYLVRMLLRVFMERPETLRSSQDSVLVRDVLDAPDIRTFVERAADKKVNELSYAGLAGIVKYLTKRLKLPFDSNTQEYRCAAELIEVRNIIVHNDGRVSSVFLSRTNCALRAGDPFPLTHDYAHAGVDALLKIARQLDHAFVSHFRLRQNAEG